MEERQLLAGDLPLGVTPIDNGELLVGTVTVTPVFFESDGSIDPEQENWTEAQVDRTLDKIRESVDWWKQLLATRTSVHTLDFTIDEFYAREGRVSTGYEPITRDSHDFQLFVGDWLTDLGYGDAPSIERAVSLFNDSQRRAHETDWAFTIFVVDSSDDDDGFFPSGFQGAFAYPGGLFMIVPSERPASTYAHELGHIFWALDEYSIGDYDDQRGYYNAHNWNAPNNPTEGFVQQVSIMRGGSVATEAYNTLTTPDETLELVGWRDSDGDGVFDFADVPLRLDAVGSYDIDSGTYSLRGSAAVDTLENQNSAGPQSDISFNRVSEIQYKIDGGDWQTALSSNQRSVDFDLQISIDGPFDDIFWRAIDTRYNVASDVLAGTATLPVISGVGGGFAYLDANRNGRRDDDESLLGGTQFSVRSADGSPLFHRVVDATQLPEDLVDPPDGIIAVGLGDRLDGRIASLTSSTDPQAGQVFQAFDTRRDQWRDTWGEDRKLQFTASETTGRVEISFRATDTGGYGLEAGSYARVEVYDAQYNRIDRVTSDLVLDGEHGSLVIEDSQGRIARVVAYGHAETEILVSSVEFGFPSIVSTDDDGVFSADGLPDGTYSVELVAPKVIYQFDQDQITFDVSGGALDPIAAAATRVDSPLHNSAEPTDVSGDGEVSVRDALLVINDVGRLGSRELTPEETTGFNVDVNNDGQVSALDALLVINFLGRRGAGEAELVSEISSPSALTAEIVGTSDTTRNAESPSAPVSLNPGAVDDVFGRHHPDDRDTPPEGPTQADPLMLKSAGKPSSDESRNVPPSDRVPGARDPEVAESGANADFPRVSLGFSVSDDSILIVPDSEL